MKKEDARCEICRKKFGNGKAAYKEAVKHAKEKHGKTEPKR